MNFLYVLSIIKSNILSYKKNQCSLFLFIFSLDLSDSTLFYDMPLPIENKHSDLSLITGYSEGEK